MQAALSSAASLAVGAALPMASAALTTSAQLIPVFAVSSLGILALLGAVSARAGGAPAGTGALRVSFWGALAMAITAGVGALFGTVA